MRLRMISSNPTAVPRTFHRGTRAQAASRVRDGKASHKAASTTPTRTNAPVHNPAASLATSHSSRPPMTRQPTARQPTSVRLTGISVLVIDLAVWLSEVWRANRQGCADRQNSPVRQQLSRVRETVFAPPAKPVTLRQELREGEGAPFHSVVDRRF